MAETKQRPKLIDDGCHCGHSRARHPNGACEVKICGCPQFRLLILSELYDRLEALVGLARFAGPHDLKQYRAALDAADAVLARARVNNRETEKVGT